MSRYVALPKPRADFWDDRMVSPLPHPMVDSAIPIKTGLLDMNGRDLYRLPDQVGFVHVAEKN